MASHYSTGFGKTPSLGRLSSKALANDIDDFSDDDNDDDATVKTKEKEAASTTSSARQRMVAEDQQTVQKFFQKVRSVSNSSTERSKKVLLTRAFLKWAKVLPLYDRCDELARIVRERSTALEAIRESYLRDVVTVKYYLQQVSEKKIDPAKAPEDMYDLHALPSANLAKFIDCVRKGVPPPSNLMHETLLNAGLINPSTGATYKPWEQSKSYRRILKFRKGNAYESPDLGGQVIALGNPSTHRVILKTCKDCMGLVTFTRSWNQEVEDALRLCHQAKTFDHQMVELKQTLSSLNAIIAKQEARLMELESRNELLEHSATFVTKMQYIQDAEVRERELTNQVRQLRQLASMAHEDHQSQLQRVVGIMQERIDDLLESDLHGKMDLDKQMVQTYKLQGEKNAMRKEIDDLEAEISRRNARIDSLEGTMRDMETEVLRLNNKVKYVQANEGNLLNALEAKDKELRDTTALLNERIHGFEQRVNELSGDCAAQEAEVDRLRATYRELKDTTKPIMEVSDQSSEAVGSEIDGEIMLLYYQPGRKRSLRSIVLAVRVCVRIAKALREGNFDLLGSTIGNKYYLQQLHRRLNKSAQDVQAATAILHEKTAQHKAQATLWQDKEARFTGDLQALQASVAALQSTVSQSEQRLALKDVETREFHQERCVAHIAAQLQRNLLHQTLEALLQLRCRVFLLRPDVLSMEKLRRMDSSGDGEDVSSSGNSSKSSSSGSENDDDDNNEEDVEAEAQRRVEEEREQREQLIRELAAENPAMAAIQHRQHIRGMLSKFRDKCADVSGFIKQIKRQKQLASFALGGMFMASSTDSAIGDPTITTTTSTAMALLPEDYAAIRAKTMTRTKWAIKQSYERDRDRVKELRSLCFNDFWRAEELVTKLRLAYDTKCALLSAQDIKLRRLRGKIRKMERAAKMAEFKALQFAQQNASPLQSQPNQWGSEEPIIEDTVLEDKFEDPSASMELVAPSTSTLAQRRKKKKKVDLSKYDKYLQRGISANDSASTAVSVRLPHHSSLTGSGASGLVDQQSQQERFPAAAYGYYSGLVGVPVAATAVVTGQDVLAAVAAAGTTPIRFNSSAIYSASNAVAKLLHSKGLSASALSYGSHNPAVGIMVSAGLEPGTAGSTHSIASDENSSQVSSTGANHAARQCELEAINNRRADLVAANLNAGVLSVAAASTAGSGYDSSIVPAGSYIRQRRANTLTSRAAIAAATGGGDEMNSFNTLHSPPPLDLELDGGEVHYVFEEDNEGFFDNDDDDDDEDGDEEGTKGAHSHREMNRMIEQMDAFVDQLNESQAQITALRDTEDLLMGVIDRMAEAQAATQQQLRDTSDRLLVSQEQHLQQQRECDRISLQNQLLRQSVEDSYRKMAKEKTDFLTRQVAVEAEKGKNKKSRGSQINCAVCEVRSYNKRGGRFEDEDDQVEVDERSHQSLESRPSLVEVHEGLASAMSGGYVLLARPRHINHKPRALPRLVASVEDSRLGLNNAHISSNSNSNGNTGQDHYQRRPTSAVEASSKIGFQSLDERDQGQGSYQDQYYESTGELGEDSHVSRGHVRSVNVSSKRSVNSNSVLSAEHYYDSFNAGEYDVRPQQPQQGSDPRTVPAFGYSDGSGGNGGVYSSKMLQTVMSNPVLSRVIRPHSALLSSGSGAGVGTGVARTVMLNKSASAAVAAAASTSQHNSFFNPLQQEQRAQSASKFRALKNIPAPSSGPENGHRHPSLQKRRTITNTAAFIQRKMLNERNLLSAGYNTHQHAGDEVEDYDEGLY